MKDPEDHLSWHLQLPTRGPGESFLSPRPCVSLGELSEMRGRSLYAGGRRPAFRLDDEAFADPDHLDPYAYQVLALRAGYVVGCCRLVPLVSVSTCGVEALLGREWFNQMLSDLNTKLYQTCEVSRLVVVPEHRNGILGLRLGAGIWATARWLGLCTLIAAVGTREHQDLIYMRAGGRPVPGLGLFPSELFDDNLRIFYFDISRPAKTLRPLIDEMTVVMKLENRLQ